MIKAGEIKFNSTMADLSKNDVTEVGAVHILTYNFPEEYILWWHLSLPVLNPSQCANNKRGIPWYLLEAGAIYRFIDL